MGLSWPHARTRQKHVGPARHDPRFEKSAWVLPITTRVLLGVHGFELTAPTHALRQPGFSQLDPALVSMLREFYRSAGAGA